MAKLYGDHINTTINFFLLLSIHTSLEKLMFIAIVLDLQQNSHIIFHMQELTMANSMYNLKGLQYGIQLKMI